MFYVLGVLRGISLGETILLLKKKKKKNSVKIPGLYKNILIISLVRIALLIPRNIQWLPDLFQAKHSHHIECFPVGCILQHFHNSYHACMAPFLFLSIPPNLENHWSPVVTVMLSGPGHYSPAWVSTYPWSSSLLFRSIFQI